MSKSARGDFHFNLDFEENRHVLIMGKDKKFSCNVCQAKLSNARNSRRHQKEAHSNQTKFFECPEEGCASTFLRPSYLTSHLKKTHGLVVAFVQAKVMGAPEQYCDASEYRRRGTPNKVGPTLRAEPVASSTSIETPMELSDTEDLISLHPGEDESFSLPDNTPIQAAPDFSEIWTADFEEDLGESDAVELLDQLVEAYDEAFPEHESASGSSSEAPHSSEPSSTSADNNSTEAPTSSSSSEHDQGFNGAGTTTDGSTTGGTTTDDAASSNTVLVQGVNLSLVRTTTKHPDGRVEEQRVASVGYTNSVNPADTDPQSLFNYIQGEFIEYINGHYRKK